MRMPNGAPVYSERRRDNATWRGFIIATIGLCVGVGLLVGVLYLRAPKSSDANGAAKTTNRPELASLVTALKNHPSRPSAGRLTGSFEYAPPPGVESARTDTPRSASLLAAIAGLKATARADQAPEHVAAAAIASLVTGEYDASIDSLESVVARKPDVAHFHSDLASAYLTRAAIRGRASDWAKALASAERAVRIEPRSVEAQYNRALALQQLGFVSAARGAWQRVLELDTATAWTREVRATLAAAPFAEPIATMDGLTAVLRTALDRRDDEAVREVSVEHPYAARRYLEETVLPLWGGAIVRDDGTAAAAILANARRIARFLAPAMHDDTSTRIVRRVEQLTNGPRRQAHALARAHMQFAEARGLAEAGQESEALRVYEEALRGFEETQSPMGEWARFWIGVIQFRQRQPDLAVTTLERVVVSQRGASAPALVGRARYVQGLVRQTQGLYEDALRHLTAALNLLEDSGEIEHAAEARMALCTAFDAMGDRERAWEFRLRSLRQQAFMLNPRDRHLVLVEAANAALRQGLTEASLVMQEDAQANARAWGHPGAFVEVKVTRAEALRREERHEEARKELTEARQFLARVPDPLLAQRWEPYIASVEVQVALPASPESAKQLARETLTRLESLRMTARQPEFYRHLGAAALALNRPDEARDALSKGLAIVEHERARLSARELRVSSFDAAHGLYAEMSELVGPRLGRWDLCFETQERLRAAGLSVSPSRALSLDALQRVVPRETAVLYYALLDSTAVVWVIRAGHATHLVLPTPPDDVTAAANDLRSALEADQGDQADRIARASERVYQQVIAPVRDHLDSASSLVIVPDGALGVIPVSLLRDPATGQALIERFVVSVAPSATWLAQVFQAQAHAHATMRPRLPEKSLFIGADRPVPGFGVLRGVRREVSESAGLYPEARVLLGDEATPENVLTNLPSAELVHVAGHAVASAGYPWLSRLVLTPSHPDASSDLFMYQIAEVGLRPGAVVVLSACDTASGTVNGTAGFVSLAGGFLAAGARTIIGTLWDVEDESAARLMAAFHRQFAARGDPVLALRAAQLEAMKRGGSSQWAAFQAIGISAIDGKE
jgi:CHAT domain-containing protein